MRGGKITSGFGRATGMFVTSQGQKYALSFEVARTVHQHSQGLMHRTKLDGNKGMLFVFDSPRQVNIWMKDTQIPLDILFVDQKGTIRNIVRDVVPLSLKSIPSEIPVLYVVEINAGTVERLGLHEGDQLQDLKFLKEGMH